MPELKVVPAEEIMPPAAPPTKAEIAAARSLDGARDLLAEMAAIAAGIARSPTETIRNRLAATVATAQVLSKMPAIAEAQLEIGRREELVAERDLGIAQGAAMDQIRRKRAKGVIEASAPQAGIEVR